MQGGVRGSGIESPAEPLVNGEGGDGLLLPLSLYGRGSRGVRVIRARRRLSRKGRGDRIRGRLAPRLQRIDRELVGIRRRRIFADHAVPKISEAVVQVPSTGASSDRASQSSYEGAADSSGRCNKASVAAESCMIVWCRWWGDWNRCSDPRPAAGRRERLDLFTVRRGPLNHGRFMNRQLYVSE